jgi:hypothetical protein
MENYYGREIDDEVAFGSDSQETPGAPLNVGMTAVGF